MKNKVTIIRFDRVNNVENKEERVRILSERKNISFFRVRCEFAVKLFFEKILQDSVSKGTNKREILKQIDLPRMQNIFPSRNSEIRI